MHSRIQGKHGTKQNTHVYVFFNAGHVHTCTADSQSLLSSLSEHTVVLVMIKHVAWSSACVYIEGQIPKHDKLSVMYTYVHTLQE